MTLSASPATRSTAKRSNFARVCAEWKDDRGLRIEGRGSRIEDRLTLDFRSSFFFVSSWLIFLPPQRQGNRKNSFYWPNKDEAITTNLNSGSICSPSSRRVCRQVTDQSWRGAARGLDRPSSYGPRRKVTAQLRRVAARGLDRPYYFRPHHRILAGHRRHAAQPPARDRGNAGGRVARREKN